MSVREYMYMQNTYCGLKRKQNPPMYIPTTLVDNTNVHISKPDEETFSQQAMLLNMEQNPTPICSGTSSALNLYT